MEVSFTDRFFPSVYDLAPEEVKQVVKAVSCAANGGKTLTIVCSAAGQISDEIRFGFCVQIVECDRLHGVEPSG